MLGLIKQTNTIGGMIMSKHVVTVCMGAVCEMEGADLTLEALRSKAGDEFTIETCECVGDCGKAPLVSINGYDHEAVTPEKADDLLSQYR
jgi:NADH:ubiquinone oxidoreductase subunit E